MGTYQSWIIEYLIISIIHKGIIIYYPLSSIPLLSWSQAGTVFVGAFGNRDLDAATWSMVGRIFHREESNFWSCRGITSNHPFGTIC